MITARLARLWQTADTFVVANEPFSVFFFSYPSTLAVIPLIFSTGKTRKISRVANLSHPSTFIKRYSKNIFTILSLFFLFYFYRRCFLLHYKIYLVLSCHYSVIEIDIPLLYILLLKILHIIFFFKDNI